MGAEARVPRAQVPKQWVFGLSKERSMIMGWETLSCFGRLGPQASDS